MPPMIRPLPFLAGALLLSGCAGSIFPSHLHDAERAALTTKLVATLDAYDQHAPSIYETLLKGSRAVAAEQDRVLAELTNNRTAARDQLLPFKKYEALDADRAAIAKRIGDTETALRDSVTAYLKAQKAAATDAATARDAIQRATEALEAAKEDVTNWNASIALLQAGVSQLPSVLQADASDSKQRGLRDLTARLRDVGAKEVEFVDADGATQKRKIRDVLEAQIGTLTSSEGFQVPDAPGATLTILTLGVNLAKIQKQRADARLMQISRRFVAYERLLAELALARALLDGVAFAIDDAEKSRILEQDAVRLVYNARIKRKAVGDALAKGDAGAVTTALQQSDVAMLALSRKLLLVRQLAVADSISLRCELRLQRDSARLAHEESLLDAQVNDQEWRSVIRSGISVLHQYEQGGFTREDAANIIRIAQTLAVAVIAGRI